MKVFINGGGAGKQTVRSAEELSCKNLSMYSFIFIGGGNTFKLQTFKNDNNFAAQVKDFEFFRFYPLEKLQKGKKLLMLKM